MRCSGTRSKDSSPRPPRLARGPGLLLLAIAAALVAPVRADAQASTPITFSVIGDVPYGSSEISELDGHVVDHNLYSPAQFLVHLGDINAGSESCQEQRYQTVASILGGLAVPAFIVPGDNEWVDCSNADQGWAWWEQHLLGLEQGFCGVPEVEAQSARPENFAFLKSGVLFVGINFVSGTPSAVKAADADWVDAQFADKGDAARAAVIFAQKEPSGSVFDAVVSNGALFGKPVLYIHGNGHSWDEDPGFFGQPNMLRVMVPRGNSSNPPVHVTVDSSGDFTLERDPWPSGTPPLNQPPCVDAGHDLAIEASGSADLDALFSDDGVPASGSLSVGWADVSGPGTVSFADPGAPVTSATFSAPGVYTLEFSADDGDLVAGDTLQVTVGSATPVLVVDDVGVGEGETARFTVSLLSADGSTVQVDYFSLDDTATAGDDYASVSGTLLFAGGTTELEVPVPVYQDAAAEPAERFTLSLSNPSGAAISDGEGVASIVDDDTLPVPNFTVAFLGDQGLGADAEAVLQLVLAEGADAVLHSGGFDYQGDPAAWNDQIDLVLGPDFPYFAAAGSPDAGLFYAPGGYQELLEARMTRIGVPWQGDLGAQSVLAYGGVFFVLTAPDVFGPGDGYHDDYVRDRLALNESVWSVSSWHKNMSPLQVGSAGDDTGWGVYEASRRGGAIIATAHSDTYSRTHLLSDVQSQSVVGTSGALELAADATGTPEDEGRSFAFVSGLGGQSIGSQQSGGPWWASVYTSDQSAAPGALFGVFNYGGDPGLAYFYFRDITGAVADSFFVASSAPGLGPRLLVDDASLVEGDAGTAELVFTAQLLSPDGSDVAVDYATSPGSASPGTDYEEAAGQLSFSGGTTVQEIRVTVNADLDPEEDESLAVTLSNPINAGLSRAQATGTILDDDLPPITEYSFAPVADAKVRSSRPDQNYGSDLDLRVKSSSTVWHGYLLFDVDTGGTPVTSALLRLHVNDGSSDGGTFFASGTGWTEGGITWNNAPGPVGAALGSLGAVAAGATVEIDVSDAVTGDGPVGLYFESSASNSTYYSSREGASPPQLVVTAGAPPAPTPPVAEFTASPTSGSAPLEVVFTDLSSGSPDTWSWDFGDGNGSSAASPTHSYAAEGTYTVSLSVGNAAGSHTETKVDHVSVSLPPPPPAPGADFAASPSGGTAPLAVAFSDLSTGSPTSWSWSFGDGGVSSQQNPSHTYSDPGSYDVSLTVSNATGDDTLTRSAYLSVDAVPAVQTLLPVADAKVNASSPDRNYGSSSELRVKNSSSSVWHAYLRFDVDTGGKAVSSAVLRLYSTQDAGGATVHATDDGWTEGGITWNNAPAPSGGALGTFPSVPAAGVVELDVSAAVSGSGPVSFHLEKAGSSSDYYSSREGSNPPELVVSTSDPVAPAADFAPSPSGGPAPLEVSFADLSSGPPDAWSWDFGDGNGSTAQSPTHTYAAPGSYSVTLGVSNGLGSDSVTKTVVATEAPAIVTLEPVADAKVSESKNGTNFGGDPDLRVKQSSSPKSYHSHLRFDVPSLAGPVFRATLRLFVDDGSSDGGSVFATDSGWSEDGVSWDTAPALLGAALGSLDAGQAGVYTEVDVTDAVVGAGPVSFGISSSTSNSVYYSSREGANPPQLVIETTPAGS